MHFITMETGYTLNLGRNGLARLIVDSLKSGELTTHRRPPAGRYLPVHPWFMFRVYGCNFTQIIQVDIVELLTTLMLTSF